MLKRILSVLLLCSLAFGLSLAGAETTTPVAPEAAYFDDAVIVGDSLTGQLLRYRSKKRNEGEEILGTARFLNVGAYSVYLASLPRVQKDKPTLLYRGQPVTVSQGLSLMGARKVVLFLGLADSPGKNPEQDIYRYTKMVGLIREAVPDIQVICLSLTPIMESAQDYNTKQKGIDLFNENLKALCEELDMLFVDVATGLKDENGFLPGYLSNDKNVHLNEDGLAILVQALHSFARQELAKQGQ